MAGFQWIESSINRAGTTQARAFAWIALLIFSASNALAQSYFRGDGLATIPTANALEVGRYVVGLNGDYDANDPVERLTTGVSFDAGVFGWFQAGARWSPSGESGSSALAWNGRAQLLNDEGATPALAVGVSQIGAGKTRARVDLLVSKRLNLPSIGFFRMHAGARQPLYPDDSDEDATPIGGVEKRWFALNRAWRASAEWDGNAVVASVEQRFVEGLRIGVGIETETPRILFALSFGNAETLEEIENAKRLARQAAQLATREERTEERP